MLIDRVMTLCQTVVMDTAEVVTLYTVAHQTMQQIANRYGVTRQAVLHHLRKAGVKAERGTRVQVNCAYCGSGLNLVRCKWRRSKRHFCNEHCYYASRENPAYNEWRTGQQQARAHHKDGDNSNNALTNLAVFASQSDHMKHHHGISKVTPLWDGASPNGRGSRG